MRHLVVLWVLHALLVVSSGAYADSTLWALLQRGGQVVLIRHAVTDPGVGDPPGFKLDDCRTQRNLSDAGRDEARLLGASFREHGIPIARVLSSPWCRCLETARLAFGVDAQTAAALGNLFGRGDNSEPQRAAFRRLVAAAPKAANLILITHGSTTAAFTGINQGTAEMVVVTPEGRGNFKVAGRIPLAR